MLKKESVLDILLDNGVEVEKAEKIVNILRMACHQQFKEDWTEKETNFNRLLNEEKNKLSELKKNFKEFISKNIAQLEAAKMLFDLNKTGFTHRQKDLYCNQAKKVMDIQIYEIKSQINMLLSGDDLPF
jgi:hypothetical protein